jgi:hypothetical protein
MANESSYEQLVGMKMRAYYGLGTLKFKIPEQRRPETASGQNTDGVGGSKDGPVERVLRKVLHPETTATDVASDMLAQ